MYAGPGIDRASPTDRRCAPTAKPRVPGRGGAIGPHIGDQQAIWTWGQCIPPSPFPLQCLLGRNSAAQLPFGAYLGEDHRGA
eukprot:763445-Pyramimonas_sp.AAC.1